MRDHVLGRWIASRSVAGSWFGIGCLLFTAASATAQGLGGVSVHGFVSQGFLKSSHHHYLGQTQDGSTEFQEFAFNLSSQVNDDLRVGVQYFARDLGFQGNNQITLDWAFGDYRWKDQLGFRAGRLKMPYGLYNETADFDGARTSVLLPQSVYDLRLRDLLVAINGVQLYGSLDLQQAGGVDYKAYWGNTYSPKGGVVARFFSDQPFTEFVELDNDYTAGGGVVWNTPLSGLRVGHTLTHYDGSLDILVEEPAASMLAMLGQGPEQELTFTNINLNVSSAEVTWGDFVLAGEYARWTGDFNNPFVGLEMNWEKWYVQGSYRINDWLEVGSYYSAHYDDKESRDGEGETPNHRGWQKDLAFSTRIDLSYSMVLKLEAHFMNGTALLMNDINPQIASDPDGLQESWTMIAAKTSFVF